MKTSCKQSVARWSESFRKKSWPLRITKVENASKSWIFPTPWVDGPQIAPGHWEYCCFPLPSAEPPVFAKICTTLVDEYGSPNHAHDKYGAVHDAASGFFQTTFHSSFPEPQLPARYGFEVMPPIEDPEGPVDQADPAWDGFGQWTGHKLGGAPWLRLLGADSEQIRELLHGGYKLLIQLAEPSFSVVDLRQCDDYQGDWLFQKDRFCVLMHPTTRDIRYVWG
jgi:hypothetical protein